jgi:hypothetical protein
MTIENIQKKRFLETIYKIYYSLGNAPSENEISTIYGRYFSRYRPGFPIPVPYNDLSASSIIDHEKLNRIIAHTSFNTDVLYDSFHEEVSDLYDLITAFNFRIENLRLRRAELEKNVDDRLFAINNTDGFYYSHTNAFNNTALTDLSKTSAVVDLSSRKLSIPQLTSGVFSYVGNIMNKVSNASLEVFVDGKKVSTVPSINFSNVFNGLNNLEWKYQFESPSISLCTLKIIIPISSAGSNLSGISLIEGKINSQKPVDINIIVNNSNDISNPITLSKSSSSDYDNFSFSFSTTKASSIELFLTKVEPDYTKTISNKVKYVYDFRLEELIITAPYYDSSAIFVSQPISLPLDQNKTLTIDSVNFDANDQVPAGTSINYYIAVENGNEQSINDYSWTKVSPASLKNATNSSVVSFSGASRIESKIVPIDGTSIQSTITQMVKIPRSTQYNNPIKDYFYRNDSIQNNLEIYRLAKFSKDANPYEVYMLENTDSNQVLVSVVSGTSLDRDSWQQIITGSRKDIIANKFNISLANNQEFYQAENVLYGSIYLSTNIYMQNSLTITKNFLKSLSAQFWDIEIYLNGVQVSTSGSLAPGILSSSLTWNFKKGQNSIVVIINKSTNDSEGVKTPFNGTISLMEGISLLSIPNSEVYRNYFSFVKEEDLRTKYSNLDNVFSIINYENNLEIIYRRTEEIKEGTRVYYLTNSIKAPSSLRVRADLFRGVDSYSAPSVISYTLKFKH